MSSAIYGNQPIENPAAYERAIHRNILENARKTFSRTYEDHVEICDFIDTGRYYHDNGVITYKEGFVGSLAHAYDMYGKLTLGQVNAVRKSIEQRAARKAEWAKEKADQKANCTHVGVVGEKITLNLTIVHVVVYESAFGTNFIYIMEDADHNVVVYKGNANAVAWSPEGYPRGKGDTITITATVKEHGVREGVKQTVIQRPKAPK